MKARKEVLETWESPTAAVLQHQRINASISTHDQVSLKGGYTTALVEGEEESISNCIPRQTGTRLQRPLELRKASKQAG